ncbi:hypothetical protein QQP08_006646 [Theobroma cacao]|nr:hypothetical protein QQP08_006646 [Theobroma cacao]
MESPFKADIVKGKVALVTGGGSGIGYEISLQLGKHGASIAIMGRRKHVIDSAVAALHSQGVPHFGRLDILVNAAAGNFLVPAEYLSPNGFQTVIDIDTVGTFRMCHKALKYLKKGGPGKDPSTGGAIINISAILHYGATWYQIHASAAKAAIDSVTRSLALEWGTDHDIRVNGIAPGAVDDTAGVTKLAPEEMLSKIKEKPLYKFGEKWDIAMAALYLASDAVILDALGRPGSRSCIRSLDDLDFLIDRKFVNGTVLVVDGGQWLSTPRLLSKDAVKQLSRREEIRSRAVPTGLPKSKL